MCLPEVFTCNNTTSPQPILGVCLFIAEILVGQDVDVAVLMGSWLGMGVPEN